MNRLVGAMTMFLGVTTLGGVDATAQRVCGGNRGERAQLITTIETVANDLAPGRVVEVKVADFERYGPGVLVAIDDSAMTMADSVSQLETARPVAEYVASIVKERNRCEVVIIGWRRQLTARMNYTMNVPFDIDELVTVEAPDG